MKGRIYSADVLRVLLLLIVFLCHTTFLMTSDKMIFLIGNATGYALELFFILSGFFVSANYINRNELSFRGFIGHELKKFYPEHVLGYLACLLLTLRSLHYYGYAIPWISLLKQTLVNLFLLQSYTPMEEYVYSFNGVTWFLSSLFFCYALTVPVLKLLKNGVGRRSVTIIFLLFGTVLLRTLYVNIFNFFGVQGGFCYTNVFPPYRFLEYFCGMCLGALYTNGGRQINSWIQVFGILGFILSFLIHTYIQNMGPMFLIAELFLIYSLFFFEGIIDKIGSSTVIMNLSNITLTFFIFHQIVIKYIRWIFERFSLDFLDYRRLLWCSILALSIAMSYFIRCVCNRFRHRFLPSKRK